MKLSVRYYRTATGKIPYQEWLAKLKDKFEVAAWVPAFDGLREGLPEAKFKADFGGTDDKRFKAVVADIRKRVAALPAYWK